MGMDLTSRFNARLWEQAMKTCLYALQDGALDDAEESFVRDMAEEYQLNGAMMEPSVKQFNWLKQIAFEQEKAGGRRG